MRSITSKCVNKKFQIHKSSNCITKTSNIFHKNLMNVDKIKNVSIIYVCLLSTIINFKKLKSFKFSNLNFNYISK